MKALHYFNAVALALTATFAITLGVVSLMYWFHLDASPRMRGEWSSVGAVTLIFGVVSALAAAAFWGQWRGRRWRWIAQGVFVVGLVIGSLLIRAILEG